MNRQIPLHRQLFYLLVAGLLIPALIFVHFLYKRGGLVEQEERVNLLEQLALSCEKKQYQNRELREFFLEKDHFYLDKQLESLRFLTKERETLTKALSTNHFPGSEAIKKRVDFLSGKENALRFVQTSVDNYPGFQETVETLQHPVEVDMQDLRKILTTIEGVPIAPFVASEDRPQLIILDFKINRKKQSEKNEVFSLQLKLLKREFN